MRCLNATVYADSFGFLGGTGPSPSYPLWTVLASLPRSQPSFVLLPTQDKKEGEFFMQRLRTPSAGSGSPPPWLSCIRASPERHLRHHFFHFWPLVQTLGRSPTVGSPWSSSMPSSLERGRVAPPPPHFTLYFQGGAMVETLEKKQRNAAEFLSSILHHATIFNAFELGQQ